MDVRCIHRVIGEKSAGIPVKMSVVDPETEETTTHELNYTYDEDNYLQAYLMNLHITEWVWLLSGSISHTKRYNNTT